MRIIVTKHANRAEVLIDRDDGVLFELRPVDRKFALQHDIVHLVVEKSLGLKHGFWRTTGDGGQFDSMLHIDGRRPPHARSQSISIRKKNRDKLVEAEMIVGTFQSALHGDGSHFVESIPGRVKDARNLQNSAETIKSTMTELIAIRERWLNHKSDETLEFQWCTIQSWAAAVSD